MSIQQASYYCPVCQQQRLFTRQEMNQVPHLLVTLFSCGLYFFIWLLIYATYNAKFHCAQCGYSDAVKYLANPQLRSQEAQLRAERAALRGEPPSAFSNSFTEWFSGLNSQSKTFIIGLGVAGLCFLVVLGILKSASDRARSDLQLDSKTNSNANISNKNTATATPTVYPAGLSPAVNLEKGRVALNEGNNGTAWAHLSQIPKTAKEYVSARELLARIPERQQIEFELAELAERERNLERMATGLAYQVEPSELKKRLDNIEKQQRQIFARRRELNRKLEKMP